MSIDYQEKSNIKKMLGIDFGESKIGLAMAETETRIAFVYTTLKNDKLFFEKLLKIIKKENIDKIIIGTSKILNQKKVILNEKKIGELIKKVLPKIEIEYQNEMFSTKSAQINLIKKGVKNIQRFDDQEAAKIILQDWLDLKK